ncbi:MAG: hypothetical protein KGD67_03580 [Candidatus Lokiarchaeota archaeon]|nr:hypothetical protein [Candidatus Lokiarchaeota archaeon]
MTLFDQLNKHQLKELLVKCWMTHDGSWFYNCVKEFGIETANRLNKASIKSLSPIEMQRIKAALGLGEIKIESFEQLRDFIDNGFSILKGDFMKFNYTFPEKNVMHWEMEKCFAYDGMLRIGVKEKYECGLIYRVCCWLDVIGVKYTLEPKINECLLHSQNNCVGELRFNL